MNESHLSDTKHQFRIIRIKEIEDLFIAEMTMTMIFLMIEKR